MDYRVYHCLNLKLRLRQYPSIFLSLSYHKYYKVTSDKDIRNDFTILYVRDPILLNRWYTIFAISKPITHLSLLIIFLSWSSMRRRRWSQKSSEFIPMFFIIIIPIQLYWTYTRTVDIHKRQSAAKRKLQLEADKKET